MTCWSARGNGYLQVDALLDNFSPFACCALSPFSENIAHSLAVLAVHLGLGVHAWAYLHHLDSGSLALAVGALSYIGTSLAIADVTEPSPLLEIRHIASSVQLVESHFELFPHWLHLRLLVVALLLPVHHLEYF